MRSMNSYQIRRRNTPGIMVITNIMTIMVITDTMVDTVENMA